MQALVAMVRSLSARLAKLEDGRPCPGDWLRLEAAVARVAIAVRHELAGMCPSLVDRDAVGELMDELRYIKLCAEGHLFELAGSETHG
ncbi:MAG: hypothetical protein JNL83_35485 [Myxococcales bacterium]|nr:hypothetical protein [Myxococcales bacterium]